ncbi:dynamin family protein [Nonomuraea turcica]|uniref:dynamin family protein n=1 Tax=Nonomuraea sp. G32 TaxID=3067274 RepID=UPI00273B7F9B|nr:dynamin family protein [Nonomuraea sp. G32]MDP4501535.1 dynamin family protein [Nonomuraea sp. G32]
MDDGRPESLGEQTLSFRPVRDDDDTFDAFAPAGGAKATRPDDPRPAGGRTGHEEPAPEDSRPGRAEPPAGDERVGRPGPSAGDGRAGRPGPSAGDGRAGREEPRAQEAGAPGESPQGEAVADRSGAQKPAEAVNFFAPRRPATGTGRSAPEPPPASAGRSTAEPPSASEPETLSASEPETLSASEPGTLSASEPETLAASEPETLAASEPEAPVAPGPRPEPRKPEAPADSAPSGGPSLFVKPAALDGPAVGETSAEQQMLARDEPATAPAAEQSDGELLNIEQPVDAGPSDEPPGDAEAPGEEPHSQEPSAGETADAKASPDAEASDAEASDAEGLHDADESQDADESHVEDRPSPEDEPVAAEEQPPAGDPPAEGPGADEPETPEPETHEPEAHEPEAGSLGSDGNEGSGEASATRTEELPAEAAEALAAALGTLRESVADLRFGLDLPGAEEARQAQADLLTQLEDYVLPRVKTSTAPALIVVAGSTGAGKSTLINSLAERNVSRTGVRRPTTGTPVLVCHPEDRDWFTEGELLGNLERLDQPSPNSGMRGIVIVATEKLPQGVALLDTPDIDSVVEEHHDVAHRMLDAADLWIFVTTAARYADAPAWNLLKLAKERGARLAIVLSRVQQRSADVVLKHFVRMLTEYGLGEIDRFVIHESKVEDGRLPDSEVTDLRMWLAELSVDEERRAQAVRETLNGVLDSFRTRVPALAKHLEAQAAFRTELRSDVEAAFFSALSAIDKASKNGSLLHGEVLARWQDFAGSGDLMRSLRLRKRGRAARQAPERVLAFKAAIRTGLESVIVAAANRAAEEVAARWRHRSELGAKLGEGLDRPSDDLVRHTSRAIASWQEHLSELVRTEGVAKRSVSKLVSFDPDSLSLIFMVAMFHGSNGEGVPHRLVNALLGAESLRGIGAKALSDLRARIGMLFDQEALRYAQALDSAGIPDESVATRLYQATYNLEVAR